MLLNNLRVTVREVTATSVTLETENGAVISIPAELLPEAAKGAILFLAADTKPLIASDKQAKDILNELITS